MSTSEPKKHLLFISHAAIDQELARKLKEVIEAAFSSVEVFVASDPEDLAPGDPWADVVLENLKKTAMLIAITTERGLSRKWVWFEAGTAWKADLRLIPCCVGKVRKDSLPPPFSQLQAANIDTEPDLRSVFTQIEKQFGAMRAVPNFAELEREMIRLDLRAEERFKIALDPLADDIRKTVEDALAKLAPAHKEAIRLLLIEGEMSDHHALVALREKGRATNWSNVFEGLSINTGFVQNVPGTNRWTLNQKLEPFLRELLVDKS
jgi:hypothetical protein